MRRRDFLKKGFLFTAGAFVLSPFLKGNNDTLAAEVLYPESKPLPHLWKPDEINVAWIGHSTMLINFYGTVIITDPVLFKSIGLYLWGLTLGSYRYTYPALEFEEIPKPDLVLLSHAHMDHMDFKTLSELSSLYPGEIDCLTAFNTMDVISELNWKSLQEIDWNQQTELCGIKIKALEVKHFGWRYPWEKDRSRGFMKEGRSYNAYVLEKNGSKILFGGDTAYTDKFKVAKLDGIDIALMPIGSYNPWKKVHCNPEEALIMAADHIKAKHFIPMHCYTFHQGQEPIEEPLSWLLDSAGRYDINIGIKRLGETFTI